MHPWDHPSRFNSSHCDRPDGKTLLTGGAWAGPQTVSLLLSPRQNTSGKCWWNYILSRVRTPPRKGSSVGRADTVSPIPCCRTRITPWRMLVGTTLWMSRSWVRIPLLLPWRDSSVDRARNVSPFPCRRGFTSQGLAQAGQSAALGLRRPEVQILHP